MKQVLPAGRPAFTLVELIASIVILLIMLTVIFSVYLGAFKNFRAEFNKSDAKQSAGNALQILTSELRGALLINTYESSAISFWLKDTNGNSLQDSSERVTFSWTGLAGDNLIKTQEGISNYNIATNVQNFSINYNSSLEVFNLSLNLKEGDASFNLSASVKPRNL